MAVHQVAGVALPGGAVEPLSPRAGLLTALLEGWFLTAVPRTARPQEAALLTFTPG